MQIQVSEAREINHPLRDDAAIPDDDDRVGPQCFKLFPKFMIRLDCRGLRNRDAERDCRLFPGV